MISHIMISAISGYFVYQLTLLTTDGAFAAIDVLPLTSAIITKPASGLIVQLVKSIFPHFLLLWQYRVMNTSEWKLECSEAQYIRDS